MVLWWIGNVILLVVVLPVVFPKADRTKLKASPARYLSGGWMEFLRTTVRKVPSNRIESASLRLPLW